MESAILPPYRWPRRGLGERWAMRIPPLFADCVAFLCEQKKGVPGGTAFFVELEEPDYSWTYLVTALHCLDEIEGQDVYVRVNTLPTSSPGFEDISTRKDDWLRHDQADVAAIISPIDQTRFPFQQIPMDLSIDAQYRFDVAKLEGRGNPVLEPMLKQNFPKGIAVEVGDELFSPGLFIQSAGKTRNLPVVRFGNIARLPTEEMIVLETEKKKTAIRAYLAETHSWGGFSGSPVFWHFDYPIASPILAIRLGPEASSKKSVIIVPEKQSQPERMTVLVGRGYATGLLGLVSGHYDIPKIAKQEDIRSEINAGIAVITPAANIKELLMSDDAIEGRNERKARLAELEPTATADSARLQKRSNRDIEIPPISREKFFGALKKATRKRDKK